MEHRCGNRHPLRTLVVLYAAGGAAVRGHTREVSISGMFVDVASAHFVTNSVIDIELTVAGTSGCAATAGRPWWCAAPAKASD